MLCLVLEVKLIGPYLILKPNALDTFSGLFTFVRLIKNAKINWLYVKIAEMTKYLSNYS